MLSRLVKILLLLALFMGTAGLSTYITVHLLIQSKDTVVVPELEGKEIVYALEMLSDLGLNIKVPGSAFNAAVPKNHVISQDPPPGTQIKKGRDVRLVLSKGAHSVVVPNLTGVGIAQARILLDENGLGERSLGHLFDPAVPRNDVIAQYPPPGRQHRRGDSVDLLVSAGPEPSLTAMAPLVGMNESQALVALEDFRLTVASIQYIDDERFPDATVTDHKPAAGYPAGPAIGVELSVNRRTRLDRSNTTSGVDFFRYRLGPGYLRKAVRVQLERPDATIELFNAHVRPAEEIWLFVPYTASSTLLLYVDDELIKTKHYTAQE